jgi:HlyD family secretion protein
MDISALDPDALPDVAPSSGARLRPDVARLSRNARRALWLALALAIVAGAVWTVRRTAAARAIPEVRYERVKADVGPIVASVTATGTLSALVTVQVGSQDSGRVQEIMVDYNSPVKAGQVIAKLDPLLFQAAVDQSRANYMNAQSSLKTANAQEVNAEHQYQRSKSLLGRGLVNPSDFDTAESNYEVAKAQVDAAASTVEVARAALHQAEVNLDYATIVSPIDGTVISRNIDVGQTVASAFQAPTLFLIAKDLRKMQVDTSVSEADVGRLEPGKSVTFTVDAYPGEPFAGTVRQIRNAATTVQNVVTYDAVIDVDNRALKLKPGMTANVTFVVGEKSRVIRVANAALRFQPDVALLQQLGVAIPGQPGAAIPGRATSMTTRWLWTLRDDRPSPVVVEIGLSDGTLTEITRGDIHEEDTLVTDMAAVPRKRFGLF